MAKGAAQTARAYLSRNGFKGLRIGAPRKLTASGGEATAIRGGTGPVRQDKGGRLPMPAPD